MGYKDPEWLREKYRDNTLSEMAEMQGVSKATIIRWMDKHGIDRRSSGVQQATGKYKDKEWLRDKYVSERRSMKDIADEFGVSKETVKYWLKKHDIPIRSHSDAAKIRVEQHPNTVPDNEELHPTFYQRRGYEIIKCGVNDEHVEHHRLLATLLVDELSDLDGKHVHHTHDIRWLNYLDGIEVLEPGEHTKIHEPHLESPRGGWS